AVAVGVGEGVPVGTGIHCPRRIETAFETKPALATAKSCLPSPSKSPIATERGPEPTLTSVEPLKPPKPSPRRIETVVAEPLTPSMAKATSCLPSRLKSPIATEPGLELALTLVEPLNPPKPSPRRNE